MSKSSDKEVRSAAEATARQQILQSVDRIRRELVVDLKSLPNYERRVRAAVASHRKDGYRHKATATSKRDLGVIKVALDLPSLPACMRKRVAIRLAELRQLEHKFLTENARLVHHTCKKYLYIPGVDREDLFQEASYGMLRAIELFDPKRGLQFSTYAVAWIMQKCQRYLACLGTVRVPTQLGIDGAAVANARGHLAQSLGHEPEDSDVADFLEVSITEIQRRDRLKVRYLALDAPLAEDGSQLHEVVADESISAAHESDENTSEVSALLVKLKDEESRRIISLHFGLEDGKAMALQTVSRELRLPYPIVMRKLQQSLQLMRQPVAA